jgi:hypothetical protein
VPGSAAISAIAYRRQARGAGRRSRPCAHASGFRVLPGSSLCSCLPHRAAWSECWSRGRVHRRIRRRAATADGRHRGGRPWPALASLPHQVRRRPPKHLHTRGGRTAARRAHNQGLSETGEAPPRATRSGWRCSGAMKAVTSSTSGPGTSSTRSHAVPAVRRNLRVPPEGLRESADPPHPAPKLRCCPIRALLAVSRGRPTASGRPGRLSDAHNVAGQVN